MVSRGVQHAALFTLGAVAVAELFAFLLPAEAQPFHRAGFLLVLAAMIASAWRGLRAALVSGVIGAIGIEHLFFAYGGPLGPPAVRLVVGGTIAGFGFALAALIGHLRDREKRALQMEHDVATSLLDANRSLRAANETLEAFSFVVSHDLKEPVRAMDARLGAFVEDFGEDARIPEEARKLVLDARSANDRLARLVHALLDLSRATRIDARHFEQVAVAEALRSEECTIRYAELARESGARVDLEVADDLRLVGDRSGVAQVLGNLIANAVVHNPARAPAVRVSASHDEQAGMMEVLVEDNGGGFPPAVVASFDAGGFPASTRGSGFGLAIARRAVERMGGTISLDRSSTLGGAAVRVRLPAPMAA